MNQAISIVAIVLTVACGSHSDSERPIHSDQRSSTLNSVGDTTIAIHFEGRQYSIPLATSQFEWFSGLQRFLDTTSISGLTFHGLELADVTGDGIVDSCITEIDDRGGVPFVHHRMRSLGNTIWSDTLSLPDEHLTPLIWEDESSFMKLKPFSSFFVARTLFGRFVGKPPVWEEIEHGEFMSYRQNERDYWKDYFQAFRGRLIRYLALPGYGEVFWDSRSKRFVRLWGP